MKQILNYNVHARYLYRDGMVYRTDCTEEDLISDKLRPPVFDGQLIDGHMYTEMGFAWSHVIWILKHGTHSTATEYCRKFGVEYPEHYEKISFKKMVIERELYEKYYCMKLRNAFELMINHIDGDVLNYEINNLVPI